MSDNTKTQEKKVGMEANMQKFLCVNFLFSGSVSIHCQSIPGGFAAFIGFILFYAIIDDAAEMIARAIKDKE